MLKNAIGKTAFFVSVAVLSVAQVFAQSDNVGIGTFQPHVSAKLEVTESGSPKKGILIPKVTEIQRLNLENDYSATGIADGLLIYEPDFGKFWYYKWDDPQPLTPPWGEWVELATGSQSQTSTFPPGGIIMWSGTIASIPAGWALCDGSGAPPNNTPDLTDRFLISVGSSAQNPQPGEITAPLDYVNVDVQDSNNKRFYRMAYIMKLQ